MSKILEMYRDKHIVMLSGSMLVLTTNSIQGQTKEVGNKNDVSG